MTLRRREGTGDWQGWGVGGGSSLTAGNSKLSVGVDKTRLGGPRSGEGRFWCINALKARLLGSGVHVLRKGPLQWHSLGGAKLALGQLGIFLPLKGALNNTIAGTPGSRLRHSP